MAWMSSNGSVNIQHRRRRPMSRGSRPSGAALLLALCVAGLAVSRGGGGVGVAAARLPLMEEVYQPNGGDPGVVGNPENVEVDPASLVASAAEQQLQALLDYLEDPLFQSQMYTQQQLAQFVHRLRQNPDVLAKILAKTSAARHYSLAEDDIARMPVMPAAVSAIEATPAPPLPKRGNYMALCHFKICNMGRKRRQEMP